MLSRTVFYLEAFGGPFRIGGSFILSEVEGPRPHRVHIQFHPLPIWWNPLLCSHENLDASATDHFLTRHVLCFHSVDENN